RIGTTATAAGMAAAVGRPPPPALGLAVWLGLAEGLAVLLPESEALALALGVEPVEPPPTRLERKMPAAVSPPTTTTTAAMIRTTRPEPKGPGSDSPELGGYPEPDPPEPPDP
ncbi:MAG TPA: hypothetical protein VNT27_12635, partial [Propionibacteriaceae bacterium]|nr:hypothetical protein [Propionibacteriaceae bacterium]